jgi:L-ascorbate metabolism protein UlaG (beta-lactamase superfamily)
VSAPGPAPIDTSFAGPVTTEANSGWTCVVMPGSGDFFGTRKAVKVAGTIDGHAFEATLLPIGDGTHMVPLNAALRKRIGKRVDDIVEVTLHRRTT